MTETIRILLGVLATASLAAIIIYVVVFTGVVFYTLYGKYRKHTDPSWTVDVSEYIEWHEPAERERESHLVGSSH